MAYFSPNGCQKDIMAGIMFDFLKGLKGGRDKGTEIGIEEGQRAGIRDRGWNRGRGRMGE